MKYFVGLMVSLMLVACSGEIAGRTQNESGKRDTPGHEEEERDIRSSDALKCDGVCAGSGQMLRITGGQYINAVDQVFGLDVAPLIGEKLPGDHRSGAFASNAGLDVDIDMLRAYQSSAKLVSEKVVADAQRIFSCSVDNEECRRASLKKTLHQLFRREVDEQTLAEFVELSKHGMDAALEAALLSPDFLYRAELGEPAGEEGLFRLNDYELAERLAFFLWQSTPDEELLALAKRGELSNSEQVMAQARKMVADPRFNDALEGFIGQWLGIDRITTKDADSEELKKIRPELLRETMAFAKEVVANHKGSFNELMTANFSVLSPEVGQYYGVEAKADDTTNLASTGRRGVLGHASFMFAHATESKTAAIYRGKAIRERFLCQKLPSPPEGTNTDFPSGQEGTSRDRLQALTGVQPCVTCHEQMNPIGFAFEHYDLHGAFRKDDNGLEIDSTGYVVNSDIDTGFDGVGELASALAESEQVRVCATRQWFRFAMQRVDVEQDGGSLGAAFKAFEASDWDMRELAVAIAASDAFLYRRL